MRFWKHLCLVYVLAEMPIPDRCFLLRHAYFQEIGQQLEHFFCIGVNKDNLEKYWNQHNIIIPIHKYN